MSRTLPWNAATGSSAHTPTPRCSQLRPFQVDIDDYRSLSPLEGVITFKDWTAYCNKMEKRVCRTCQEEKDVICFSKDRCLLKLDCSKCLYQKYKTRHTEYYESNKEHYRERRGEKIICECGISVRRDGISRHQKSEKHLDLMTKK